jgi:hypothetical protein
MNINYLYFFIVFNYLKDSFIFTFSNKFESLFLLSYLLLWIKLMELFKTEISCYSFNKKSISLFKFYPFDYSFNKSSDLKIKRY